LTDAADFKLNCGAAQSHELNVLASLEVSVCYKIRTLPAEIDYLLPLFDGSNATSVKEIIAGQSYRSFSTTQIFFSNL